MSRGKMPIACKGQCDDLPLAVFKTGRMSNASRTIHNGAIERVHCGTICILSPETGGRLFARGTPADKASWCGVFRTPCLAGGLAGAEEG